MMSRDCIAFLAAVVEMPTAAPGLENIPINREFSNVFSLELTMIPLDREIEFVINGVLETATILKKPYRMARAELRELRRSCRT